MREPTAAEALYPHLPRQSDYVAKSAQRKQTLAQTMYRHLPSRDAERRAQERQAIWNNAVEAGIKMQLRAGKR